VERLIPPVTQAQWEEAILAAQRYLHGYGITAMTDAWVEAWHVAPYRALAERGDLTMRTVLSLWWARGGGLEQLEGFEDSRRLATVGRLRASTVKLMMDGVLETYTGSLLEPYLGPDGQPTDNRGIEFIDPERMAREFGPALDRAGFQLHFHAIGDQPCGPR
jgi:predicted amidohydrolase YtcJ